MSNKIQVLRSSVAGARPTGKQPGELYVNFHDRALGYINAAGEAADITMETVWIDNFPSQIADPTNPAFMDAAAAYTEWRKTNPEPKGQFCIIWDNQIWTPDAMDKDLTDITNWTNRGTNDILGNYAFVQRNCPEPVFTKPYATWLAEHRTQEKALGHTRPYDDNAVDLGWISVTNAAENNPDINYRLNIDPSYELSFGGKNPDYLCGGDLLFSHGGSMFTSYPQAANAYLKFIDLTPYDGLTSISVAFRSYLIAGAAASAATFRAPRGNILAKWKGKAYFHVKGSGALDTDWAEIPGGGAATSAKTLQVMKIVGVVQSTFNHAIDSRWFTFPGTPHTGVLVKGATDTEIFLIDAMGAPKATRDAKVKVTVYVMVRPYSHPPIPGASAPVVNFYHVTAGLVSGINDPMPALTGVNNWKAAKRTHIFIETNYDGDTSESTFYFDVKAGEYLEIEGIGFGPADGSPPQVFQRIDYEIVIEEL